MDKPIPNRLFPREIGWGGGSTWFLREERAGAREGRLWVPPPEAELSLLMEPPSCPPGRGSLPGGAHLVASRAAQPVALPSPQDRVSGVSVRA